MAHADQLDTGICLLMSSALSVGLTRAKRLNAPCFSCSLWMVRLLQPSMTMRRWIASGSTSSNLNSARCKHDLATPASACPMVHHFAVCSGEYLCRWQWDRDVSTVVPQQQNVTVCLMSPYLFSGERCLPISLRIALDWARDGEYAKEPLNTPQARAVVCNELLFLACRF